MRRAAIDVGSNSVLLTIEELVDGNWRFIAETSQVTALGAGTKSTGILSSDSMDRTLAAVGVAWNLASEHDCQEIRAAGTMALRIAANAKDFLRRAETNQTPVTIITGGTEAALGFHSVSSDPTFGIANRLAIIDPGGHSTELVVAIPLQDGSWGIEFQQSFSIGTLAMLSGVFSDECPSPSARIAACIELDEHLGSINSLDANAKVVTLGATGANLISIRERLEHWSPEKVHGQILTFEEISKAVGWLSDVPLVERNKILGMEPGRAGTLHAGALILERFLYALRAENCGVSVRGWRHAWLELGYPIEFSLQDARTVSRME